MAHAEGIEVINRSPADVFAFLANGENNSKWRPMVLETTHAPGTPEGLGAIYRQRTAGTYCRSFPSTPLPDKTTGHRTVAATHQ